MAKVKAERIVNGIPSGYHFRFQLGRTGVGRICKMPSSSIDGIIKRLTAIEGFRNISNHEAIANLRSVRRRCYSATNSFTKNVPQTDKICQLTFALSNRIGILADQLYAHAHVANANTLSRAKLDEAQAKNRHFRPANFGNAETGREADTRITEGAKAWHLIHDQHHLARIGTGRVLGENYHNERANPMHVSAGMMREYALTATSLSLKTWGDTVYTWRIQDGDNLGTLMAGAWDGGKGVRYLDHEDRKAFAVTIRAGQVRDAEGNRHHTGHMNSRSGAGWGIYVVDFNNTVYVGEHETNRFHHSSFLAGSPVKAAGEISIDRGVVVGLTNKTGHYKSEPAELNVALGIMERSGVNMNRLAVSDPFRATEQWYRGTDALAANGDLSNMTAARIPKPAAVAP